MSKKDELIANQYVYIKNLEEECKTLEERVKELEKIVFNDSPEWAKKLSKAGFGDDYTGTTGSIKLPELEVV